MKVLSSVLIFILFAGQLWSQENQVPISGTVVDAKTKAPLANATVEVKGLIMELITNLDGGFEFEVPAEAKNDSLTISHIGYKTFRKRIGDMQDAENIFLYDYSVELRAITITSRTLRLKEIDKFLKPIRGNLYAYETETTLGLYNLFLDYLEEHGQPELLKQCNYDLSGYDAKMTAFFKEYNAPYKAPQNKKDTTVRNYSDFPAVNISHGAATVFCQWLTEQYNIDSGKKKFKKVKFRLPTLKEWQIAALGYAKFQSWNLTENKVEVIIPADTFSVVMKGNKTTIPVNHEILYPWWNHYNYRKKVQNQKNCFLGNFKIPAYMVACNASYPGKDGWTKMAQTASYFPNNIGLYDMVGNVAEMIEERGKACGGSWDDFPEASTIHSVKSYRKPDDSVGFRLFMEVIDE